MRKLSKSLAIAALVAIAVLVWPAAGVGAKSSTGKPVTVQLYEFAVLPKPKFVAAGKVSGLQPKKSGKLTTTLPAGDYEIFCNLTTTDSQGTTYVHYAQGMHQTFQAG